MAGFAEKMSDGHRVLIFDCLEYTERVLANGTVNWADAQTVASFLSKTQGLIKSDTLIIPVDKLAQALCESDGDLRSAMSAKLRGARPLKSLLANEEFRALISEILTILQASQSGTPLSLMLPAPGDFANFATRLAGGEEVDIDDDLVDDAAVYIADFLRTFSDFNIAAIILEETNTSSQLREFYAPVWKVIAHYNWVAVLSGAKPASVPILSKLDLPKDFWEGAVLSHDISDPVWIKVPQNVQPENVLNGINRLRSL